jgi:ArsR family transcriptional regulator, arsenate/arsenite/antimonite-responsive transcriptional repressor
MYQRGLMYVPRMTNATELETAVLVQRLKALGDEKRLRIMAQLSSGERCVCDLMDDLGAGQSLLSFHLRTLKEAGLVTDRRQGRWVYYALNAEALAQLEQFVGALRAACAQSPGEVATCCE